MFALRVAFFGGLLYAMFVSVYILVVYLRRAFQGDRERRWLGRHITAIAVSHLGLLAWVTARFLAHWELWTWPWIIALGLLLALSDYAIWQMYRYRRWREKRAQGAS